MSSFGLSLSADFAPPEPDVEEPPIAPARVAAVVTSLDKAVRARRLYQDTNPAYHGFVRNARESFARLWQDLPELNVQVEERSLRWLGHPIAAGEGRENLAFTFYKDGIRTMTFMSGFEEELEAFLDVLHRIRGQDQNASDDMVTLLWEREFTSFQYTYVNTLAEGLQLPAATVAGELRTIPLDRIERDAGIVEAEEAPPTVRAGTPPVAAMVSHHDFNETMYLLEAAELAQLGRELKREMERDVRTDVLQALFDRLEDPVPARQQEILTILHQLLPAMLAGGDLRSAAMVLTELDDLTALGVLDDAAREAAAALLRELSEPKILRQIMTSLLEGAIQPTKEELGVFLAHLGAPALPILISSAQETADPALRDRLTQGLEALAGRHPDELTALLAAPDAGIAMGAARLVGQLALKQAGPRLSLLLRRPEPDVRGASVQALLQLRDARSLELVQQALDDADRDVRLLAVRGLAALRYLPARNRVAAAINGRLLREGDLSERMAYFEAYGALAGPESVDVLDRLLNGRKLLGRQPPEIRACAAMALGTIGTNAAFDVLRKSAGDSNPVVRSAVMRALRRDIST
jgi:hypothetical protein